MITKNINRVFQIPSMQNIDKTPNDFFIMINDIKNDTKKPAHADLEMLLLKTNNTIKYVKIGNNAKITSTQLQPFFYLPLCCN